MKAKQFELTDDMKLAIKEYHQSKKSIDVHHDHVRNVEYKLMTVDNLIRQKQEIVARGVNYISTDSIEEQIEKRSALRKLDDEIFDLIRIKDGVFQEICALTSKNMEASIKNQEKIGSQAYWRLCFNALLENIDLNNLRRLLMCAMKADIQLDELHEILFNDLLKYADSSLVEDLNKLLEETN